MRKIRVEEGIPSIVEPSPIITLDVAMWLQQTEVFDAFVKELNDEKEKEQEILR